MRKVQRRATRSLIRPPWESRGEHLDGRTILSNVKDPVVVHDPDGNVHELGWFDRFYRIYRHSGATPNSVAGEGVIRYFKDEWLFLRDNNCHWIEFVHPTTGAVGRIDYNTANRYGEAITNNWGPMWAIPDFLYEGLHSMDHHQDIA